MSPEAKAKTTKAQTNGQAARPTSSSTRPRSTRISSPASGAMPPRAKSSENRNPANTEDLIGTFPRSTKEDVDRAVKSAKKAYEWWRLVPPPQKAQLFFRLVEIMKERKEKYRL